jgi:Na+-transporting NADH:ubiquinone oxidoreductase subunit NqrA
VEGFAQSAIRATRFSVNIEVTKQSQAVAVNIKDPWPFAPNPAFFGPK